MKSLEIYKPDNSTNVKFSRLFSKILPRQKDNINSIFISIKRNDVVKKYNAFLKNSDSKKQDKFNNSYNIYIDTINEYIMNKVYKRVKYGIATDYEKSILSNYYYILKLKDNKYDEYKYRKQKYLLRLDYYNVEEEKQFDDYKIMYEEKIIDIYNNLLKLYEKNAKDRSYINNILKTADEYCSDSTITHISDVIVKRYMKLKHNKKDDMLYNIRKNVMLFEITNRAFHNVVSAKTLGYIYIGLIKEINFWLNNNINNERFEEVYAFLLEIIKKYNPKDSDPVQLEKKYISKEPDKYNELKQYIEKKDKSKKNKIKKESKSNKEEKPKKGAKKCKKNQE